MRVIGLCTTFFPLLFRWACSRTGRPNRLVTRRRKYRQDFPVYSLSLTEVMWLVVWLSRCGDLWPALKQLWLMAFNNGVEVEHFNCGFAVIQGCQWGAAGRPWRSRFRITPDTLNSTHSLLKSSTKSWTNNECNRSLVAWSNWAWCNRTGKPSRPTGKRLQSHDCFLGFYSMTYQVATVNRV